MVKGKFVPPSPKTVQKRKGRKKNLNPLKLKWMILSNRLKIMKEVLL